MKPYGSICNKGKSWYIWGDKISSKSRIYYNKATRKLLRKILSKENNEL